MIMIQDIPAGKVLAQYRLKNWRGYTFPGGHVEPGESFVDSAVREAYEETGLLVAGLKGCGVIHWAHTNGRDRYLSFLYKTSVYTGKLLEESKEGRNEWMELDRLLSAPSENGLHEIIHMFTHDEYSEAFGSWNDDGVWSIDAYK